MFRSTIAFVLLLALVATSMGYLYDTEDAYSPEISKRNLENFWRSIHLQMPGRSGQKRTEALSRASANAYYRLG